MNEESTFSLTKDNKTLLIAAEYDDSFGERDIYRIDVSQYSLISQGYVSGSFSQLICTVKDAKNELIKGAVVKIYGVSSGKLITEIKTEKLDQVQKEAVALSQGVKLIVYINGNFFPSVIFEAV